MKTKLPESVLVKRQVIKKEKNNLVVEIRYDDNCGNGHNSFAITGTKYRSARRTDSAIDCCGMMHEEIVKEFPELEKYLKWHLCSSDGPMHYIANTLYHARTRQNMSLPLGAPTRVRKHLQFKNIPFTFTEQEKGFWEYLASIEDFSKVNVEAVKYDGQDSYDFGDNYTLTGFNADVTVKRWYSTPFNNLKSAEEFLEALQENRFEIISVPYEFNKAVKPNLESARSCAVWPEAVLEDFTQDKLEARLTGLLEEFKADIEALGLVY